jgi:hypothetical protein
MTDENKKISKSVIEFAKRPGENTSPGGIEFNQPLNLFDVIEFGFPDHLILVLVIVTGDGVWCW